MFTHRKKKNTESKVVPAHATKTYSGSKDKLPVIPNLSTRRRCVINFILQPYYPWEETPVPLQKEARWGQKLKEQFVKEKNLLPLAGFKPQMVQTTAYNYTAYSNPNL
jgi:hypothetical protein